MSGRTRLDEAIVARGLAPSRARARDAVLRGTVTVGGRVATKPAAPVSGADDIRVADPALDWVSRGALKLVAALDAFGFDPAGLVALDLGASTGGFTQVLLRRGAARVYAVDVGHGQIDPSVAADPRVVSIEGLNARDLAAGHLHEPPGIVVADLSFISLKLALPPALALAAPAAMLAVLVKPQFELGPDALGKGGLVRDPQAAEAAARDIAAWLEGQGWAVAGIVASPIAGGSGNREFLIGARRG